MKPGYEPVTLGRCLLAGLLTGIITSLIVVIFNVIYRHTVGLNAYEIVMPLSVFMAFPLFNLVIGGLYSLFIDHLKRGRQTFTIVVLLVMAISGFLTAFTGRRSDHTEAEFKGLILGMELIEGITAAFLIPFFVKHANLYLTAKDIRGEE